MLDGVPLSQHLLAPEPPVAGSLPLALYEPHALYQVPAAQPQSTTQHDHSTVVIIECCCFVPAIPILA